MTCSIYLKSKTKRKTLLSLINLFIEANIRRFSSSASRKRRKKSQKLIVSLNTLSFKEYLFLLCSALYLFLRLLFRLLVYEKKSCLILQTFITCGDFNEGGSGERKKRDEERRKMYAASNR